MDAGKFKSKLELTLGRRLDVLSKAFDSHKFELAKARTQLLDINKYIESKLPKRAKKVPIRPNTATPRSYNTTEQPRHQYSPPQKLSVHLNIRKSPEPPPKPHPIARLLLKPRSVRKFDPRLSLDQICSQLKDLDTRFGGAALTTANTFSISLGAKSAFDIIKGMGRDSLKLPESPDKKIIWSIGLFFQLLGEDFDPESASSKERAQELFSVAAEAESISEAFLELIQGFDFSDRNIDGVEEYVFGKEELLAPQCYTQISQVCGLIMVCLKEAVMFCGLVKGKSPIWRVYQRLLYKKRLVEDLNNA